MGEWAQRGAGRGPGLRSALPGPIEPKDQDPPSHGIGVPWKGREGLSFLTRVPMLVLRGWMSWCSCLQKEAEGYHFYCL